ncbi:MAG: efflux RND transporter periplasmic adaptor subunit [Bryobacteraceae bacterium]
MRRKTSVVVVLLAALAAGCSRSTEAKNTPVQEAPKAQPISVKTAAVETKTVERALDVTGSLQADDAVNISTEIQGRISKINFDFGQMVRKGDVVAELEKTELLIQHDRAKAAIAQALARIGLDPTQDDATPQTTPAIRQAQAQYDDAKSKFDTAKKLASSGDIAQERLTELDKAMQARQAALDAAKDDLRTQLANIQALRADKRLIEKRLGDTVVKAPFDGQVSQRMVAVGQFIRDNSTIMTIVKTWPLRLRLDVPEVAAAAVRTGSTLRFTTEAIPGRDFTATVTQINPSLDARSRSLSAEARLNQSAPELRPGMFVQVRLTASRGAAITTVPQQAVYTVAGLTKVFAIRDGKAKEIRFTPGQTVEGSVEVPGGALNPGERVALDNLGNLVDGVDVRAN